jgi:hypothetical protein
MDHRHRPIIQVPTDHELLASAHGYIPQTNDRRKRILASRAFNLHSNRSMADLYRNYPHLKTATVGERVAFVSNMSKHSASPISPSAPSDSTLGDSASPTSLSAPSDTTRGHSASPTSPSAPSDTTIGDSEGEDFSRRNPSFVSILNRNRRFYTDSDEMDCAYVGHKWKPQGKTGRYCPVCDDVAPCNEIGCVPELKQSGTVVITGLLSCLAVFIIKTDSHNIIEGIIAGHFTTPDMIGPTGFTTKGLIFFQRIYSLIHEQEWRTPELIILISKSHESKSHVAERVIKLVDWGWRKIVLGSCPPYDCRISIGEPLRNIMGTVRIVK